MDQGQEAGLAASLGPAEPPGVSAPPRLAAPVKLARASPQASVTHGNTTVNDPDRRNKVGLIQRLRLDTLGSMDPHLAAATTIKELS
jgi:hypothetical protein